MKRVVLRKSAAVFSYGRAKDLDNPKINSHFRNFIEPPGCHRLFIISTERKGLPFHLQKKTISLAVIPEPFYIHCKAISRTSAARPGDQGVVHLKITETVTFLE